MRVSTVPRIINKFTQFIIVTPALKNHHHKSRFVHPDSGIFLLTFVIVYQKIKTNILFQIMLSLEYKHTPHELHSSQRVNQLKYEGFVRLEC